MKKVFFLALAVLLSGCSKKDDIPEKVYMSGKWTQVNEQSMTSGYIEFQEGKMNRYTSSIGEVVAMEDALWHCSSSDFTEESVCSYYIQDKCLYVDGKPSGRMEGDELYIDDKLYCSFNDFEEDYYVTIVPDVTDNVITLPFCATEQEFSVSLTRSLPHSSLSVSTSDEWIKSLGLDEGNVSFVTEAPVEDREGFIRISYPGAADKVVFVMQKCKRFIRPSMTEMSFDCISREVALSYMIENPVEGEVLTVTTDAEWISEIKVEKDKVVILLASNEEGAAREAVLHLSYREANPVEVKVSQSFPGLTLSQESQETDYSSKTLSFTYSVNNAAEGQVLKAVSGVAWISGIAVDGNTVTYMVSENNSCSSRSGEITLTYAGVVRTFAVTQSYTASGLKLTPSEGSSDYAGGTYEFGYSITNEREGESVRATSSSDWITAISVSGGKISYKVGLNATGKSRSGEIVVKYSTATATYKVTQSAAEFTLSESSASHGYASASGTIGYNIANRHDSEQLKLSTTASWITGLADSNGSVRYNVSENNSGSSRSGEITLTYAGVVRTFTVTQSYTASGLKLTPSEGSSDYAGGTYEFGYSITNEREGESVRATSSSDWITGISVSGGKVSYKVGLNATGKSRSGEIVVRYSTATATYKVTQSAAEFTLSESSASHGYTSASGTIGYNIANRHDSEQLKLSTTASWITGLADSNGSIRYNVSENNSGSSRSGEITLTYAGVVRTFTVTQSYVASGLKLTSSEGSSDYAGGTYEFGWSVTNEREGESVIATSSSDWITAISVSGGKISYKVGLNATGKSRTAEIVVKYSTATATHKVTQSAAEFTLSESSASHGYASASGTIGYNIANRHDSEQLKLSTTASWITGLTDSNGSVRYNVSENNSGSSRSGEITLTYAGVVRTFTVTQSYTAATITLSSGSQTTDYASKNLKFTVNITNPKENLSLSGKASAEWIQDLTINGNTVSYTVDKNTSANQREATITINYESDSKEFKLIQTGHPVTELTLNKTSVTILAGESETLAASAFPLDTKVQWSSSSPAIASVDQNGKVTGLDNGTAIITVASADGTKTATCEVTVIVPVTGVSLDRTSAEIIKGDSMTLTAIVAPSNATNKNVIWTSSDPSVATVSQSGVITAIKAGSTTVVATTVDGEKTAACEIVVIVPVNSISLDKESLELIEGDGASLTATIGPDDATDKRITWKSSDDSIAIVSSAGAVVAVKAGTVTITATTKDGGLTAECNLTVIKRVVSGGIEDTEDDNWGM